MNKFSPTQGKTPDTQKPLNDPFGFIQLFFYTCLWYIWQKRKLVSKKKSHCWRAHHVLIDQFVVIKFITIPKYFH